MNDSVDNKPQEETGPGGPKKVKLPVYHAPQRDDTVTIRLSIHPRRIERFFFIVVIMLLISAIIWKPAFLFGPCGSIQDETASIAAAPVAASLTENEPVPATVIEDEPDVEIIDPEPAEVEPDVEITAEEAPQETVSSPPRDSDIVPSKIDFQVTDFTIEKKGPTWYKLLGVTVKITNNHDIPFSPQIKVWYFDDGNKLFFDPDSPPKDQQIFSVGIAGGVTKTTTLDKIDESFSGNELNPTVIVKVYDFKTGDLIKETTKLVTVSS